MATNMADSNDVIQHTSYAYVEQRVNETGSTLGALSTQPAYSLQPAARARSLQANRQRAVGWQTPPSKLNLSFDGGVQN